MKDARSSSRDEGRDVHPATRTGACEHLQHRGGYSEGYVAQCGVSGSGECHLRGEGMPLRGT